MGRPKTFQVELLNNPSGVYQDGQVMEGRVTLELDEPQTMRGLRIEYKGKANVRWTEQRSNGKTSYTVTYSSHEKYFDEKEYLWKPKEGSDEMARGLYTFPFRFQLPGGIPSSFEERTGKVRYVVKAVIDRKFWFDYESKKAFTVLQHLDLNKEAEATAEGLNTKHKFLCCLCCRSGPITGTLRFPRKGYVPGEVIVIDADIENLSSRKMAKTMVRIFQIVDFHATTKTKTERKNVAELLHGPIEAGKSDTWRGDRMLVPPIPPSYLKGCKIIDIKYVIQLNVDPKGPALDLKVPVDIIIGSIPLQRAVEEYRSMGLSVPTPALPTTDQIYSVVVGNSDTSAARPPPPTYSESVFGRVNIKDDDDNDKENEEDNSYAPSYTYYNWGFQSSAPSGL